MATIRLASLDDAADCCAIYAPSVSDSAISFEATPPSTDEFRERIAQTLELHPWLVCEHENNVVGYAYAHEFRGRDAYQWCVESSVYVDEASRRAGVARGLYESLLATLRLQGFFDVYAAITLPNDPSVRFHESIGFEQIGLYPKAGHKHDEWHDVALWHRSLQAHENQPKPPTPIGEVELSPELQEAFAAGESSLSL